MNKDLVNQAVREAVGDKVFHKGAVHQVNTHAGKLKKLSKDETDLDTHLRAVRDSLGGAFNPNIEAQVRRRVTALEKSGKDTPAPGHAGQVTHTPDPNAGTDVGKERLVSITDGFDEGVNKEAKDAMEANDNQVSGSGGNTVTSGRAVDARVANAGNIAGTGVGPGGGGGAGGNLGGGPSGR